MTEQTTTQSLRETPPSPPTPPESFAALLEENLSGVIMQPGELITADVIEAGDDYVIVSAGLKSDAEIPAAEFKNAAGELTVQVGDQVEVTLEAVEDGFGNTRMSRERALRTRAWGELTQAFEDSTVVHGVITGKVKGGFTVEIKTLRAFLPGSLVDVRPVKDAAYIEGRELEFKIIKLDQGRNNIVVSRRAIVENELTEEREKLLNTLEEGQIVKGVVKNLTEYGAFVNLGGLDGLLHITDMAWRRVKHPSEVLGVGDEIEARVLKFDREQSRVSLGLKQLGEDPWLDLARRQPVGSRLFGKVTNITDYGAFVEIEEGVEGLVHLSEMNWTNRNIHPSKVCHVGDEVEVMVLDIDPERRRVSLGMKQCTPNPWEEFATAHKKGDVITGRIRSITDFGIFIGIEGGIDGLVHLSDLSWDRPGNEVVTEFKKGNELTVVVLAVDAGRKVRETELEGEAAQEYKARDVALGGAKLGDKLKEQLGKQTEPAEGESAAAADDGAGAVGESTEESTEESTAANSVDDSAAANQTDGDGAPDADTVDATESADQPQPEPEASKGT